MPPVAKSKSRKNLRCGLPLLETEHSLPGGKLTARALGQKQVGFSARGE